ncbi:MotA/TolQ/ExbB proton channel family protein [Loktanella agnita]|uniref:MotA/TolQ/ExbB proton channel family protein n=1 Tax=Loktanella agnita TaxID=287097 RepID=UPI003986642C
MKRILQSGAVMLAVGTMQPAMAQETAPVQPVAPAQPEIPVTDDTATVQIPEAQPAEAPVLVADTPAPISYDVAIIAAEAHVQALQFLRDGGPTIWAIAALSVITVALILWKIWRLALIGAWSRGKAGRAVDAFAAGQADTAEQTVAGRRGIRSKVTHAAIRAVSTMPEEKAREETMRVAKRELANAATGLRALELIATIAPLLGLLGTVLGMIAAFQALQEAGSKADPALLAGGIWEALLTTAAGMAVAIPASVALTWFESVIDRIRRDLEDHASRIFLSPRPAKLQMAAE